MDEIYNLKVNINKAQSEKRLDKALTNKLNKFSRSQIKIISFHILFILWIVNGQICGSLKS